MQFFVNLTIRSKVFFAFASVLLLAALLAAFSVFEVLSLTGDAAALTANFEQIEPLSTMDRDMTQLSELTDKRHILSNITVAEKSLLPAGEMNAIRQQEHATTDEYRKSWALYSPTMDQGRETADGQAFNAAFDQLMANTKKIFFADMNGDSDGALQILAGDVQRESAVFTQAMNDDLVYQAAQTRELTARAQASRRESFIWISCILGVMLFGTLAIAWAMVQGIVKPIVLMNTAMRKLAAQEMTVEIPGIGRKDEVGDMAHAVQVFRENGLERLKLTAEATEFQKTLDKKLKDMELAFEAAGHEQQQVVSTLGSALDMVAKGDLTTRFALEVTEAYRKLKADFNSALNKLQDTMQSISSNTQAVRSGAGEITHASDDLSRRTEQQAASLEETAAALDEITATVKKTAEGAAAARKLAGDAKTDAEQSGIVVSETVAAMSGIENSSKKISNIIGVIDEIAFQTNLLALNAGIEAARAGDAGRGFAVVATEVRALAQRSADAAKEIKSLISSSGQQVESGVKMVGATGNALNRIVEQVSRLNGLIAEIAASAQEQSTGLAEVNLAVNHMDQVTQQNAAMVEQTTAASHSLAEEASELARLVAKFQIGTSQDTVIPLRRETPSTTRSADTPRITSPAQPSSKTVR